MALKLFVCGEKTADPEKWSKWSEVALVIAETPEKALEMTAEFGYSVATEIPMDKPLFICKQSEPNHGEDI